MPDERGSPSERRAMGREMRCRIIRQSLNSQVGHVGSALSVVDIMTALWGGVMRDPGTASPTRDRFILGKGHAALALYCALRWNGLLDDTVLQSYCGDGSRLGVHPEQTLPGVDVSTGSLGQGLSIGCGLAYAMRGRGLLSRVYVLLSDAECNEGQVWEAAMFAAHHRLSNLIAIVDLNGMQALGGTETILSLQPLARRWLAFGWETFEADGHDPEQLVALLTQPPSTAPRVVIARTVLGKGVSFMQHQLEWRYRNLTPGMAQKALEELEADR